MKNLYNWAVNIGFVKKLMSNKLFAKLLSYEVLIYVFFGVVTTLINLVCFALFNRLFGDGPIFSLSLFGKTLDISFVYLSNFLAWIIAVLTAFVTNKLYVFESRSWQIGLVIKELIGFITARIFSLIFEMLGLALLFDILKINPNVSKFILAIVVVIMNYFFSKFLIFKKK